MPSVSIKDKVVLVSGSNRGIGKSFVMQALEMGAIKVYATARDESTLAGFAALNDARLVPLTLDVTNQEQVDAAAAAAADVEILINNSGVDAGGPIIGNLDESSKRLEMDVNYFGIAKMCVAFAPILKANGGGAIVNILSVAALNNFAFAPGYSASKAAARSLTQALRTELGPQNTLVSGVFPGPIDTEMAKNVPIAKESPDAVAIHVFEGIAQGHEDIFPDPFSVEFAKQMKSDAKAVEKADAARFKSFWEHRG
ncbi:MAG: NAD(P)-dependent dehydrogenase (short-subunit alcohol dehydrogenase family) [Oceanicoccus sp.]|jgi:NAD(P)-dependent dehydrogenase (short-subunit alcohol dehydrogenase family)